MRDLKNTQIPCAQSCRLRIFLLSALVACLSAVLFYRLYELQGSQREKWKTLASRQHNSGSQIGGARGSIFDSRGRPLAVSMETLSVALHPRKAKLVPEQANSVAELLRVSEEKMNAAIHSKKPFVWLAKGVPTETRALLDGISRSAFSVFTEFRRYYPQGKVASKILGVVGAEGKGLSGIELAHQEELQASDRRLLVHRDGRGAGLSINALTRNVSLAEDTSTRSEGAEMTLSIDTFIQSTLERELRHAAKETLAKQVFAVMLDADTGAIIAMADSFEFDPNDRKKLSTQKLRNVSIQDVFEPGSTLKPLIAAVALENAKVSASESLDCSNGRFRVGSHTIRDVHKIKRATLRDVLVQSSNICMAKLGQRLGKKKMYSSLRELGFGEKTGVELPGEARGILRKVERWKEIDVATASFGQGLAVTAVQLAQAYASLANGGFLVTPSIFKVSSGAKKRVFSEKTAKTISEMIAGVINDGDGTAPRARISGATAYGKTGTAQKPKENGRGYDPDKVLASFVGYLDGSELGISQKIVMAVMVDEPGVTPRWGGRVAAPVFRRTMERVLTYLLSQPQTSLRANSLGASAGSKVS